MHTGEEFLGDENGGLAEIRPFAGAVERQRDLAGFSF